MNSKRIIESKIENDFNKILTEKNLTLESFVSLEVVRDILSKLGFIKQEGNSQLDFRFMNELCTVMIPSDKNPGDSEQNKVLVYNIKRIIWAMLKLNMNGSLIDNSTVLELGNTTLVA